MIAVILQSETLNLESYMSNSFDNIKQIIQQRRTIKPNLFNSKQIPDEKINDLLELANWAPTHGNTQPWFFYVYANEAVKEFCHQHAELYKINTVPENFMKGNYDKLAQMGDKASHIIVACMKRGNLPKIPVWEELAAASSAVQNMLLGATALGIASYWGSGGMAQHQPMKDFLGLGEHDSVIGILYLGYSDEKPTGRRVSGISDKVIWEK